MRGRGNSIKSLPRRGIKTVILAGGKGTRLAEETEVRPKPMVEIGAQPILWHILKHYGAYGFREFLVALGYKGEIIKRYFLEYYGLSGSLTLDLSNGAVTNLDKKSEDWIIHCLDTGLESNTAGRLRRLYSRLKDDTFMVTYGDGVSDVNLGELLRFHRRHGRIATVTAVRPPARYGALEFDGPLVRSFNEKPQTGEGWISGGFFVFEPEIFRYIRGDESSLESQVLEKLASEGQLAAYRHHGFWQCMDTVRDKRLLEAMWQQGRAPWRLEKGAAA